MTRVYYQGERGSFSEQAAVKFFTGPTERTGLFRFEDVFAAVKNQPRSYGVIPIENTLTGSIHQNYDLLLRSDLFITGEIKIRISFNLFTAGKGGLKRIREIWSHPVALEQCREYLSRHPDLKVVPVYDSAGVASVLTGTGRHDVGLIAGTQVGRIHRLLAVHERIEDNAKNFTRFLIVSGRKKFSKNIRAKTSLAFGVKNAPGVLFRCLSIFALRNIDLVKLESRPIAGKPWEYLFYADFIGSIENERCRRAVQNLNDVTLYTKILGSYETRRG